MKKAAFIFLMFLSATTYAQKGYDTSEIAVIPLDTAQHWSWHLEGNRSTGLTIEQINRVDSILNVCISENNNNGKQTSMAGVYIGIYSFKKQFVPSINEKGELEVWVNCFSYSQGPSWSEGMDWKKEMVIINDGGIGGGLFNVNINLTTKKYSKLYVNGI